MKMGKGPVILLITSCLICTLLLFLFMSGADKVDHIVNNIGGDLLVQADMPPNQYNQSKKTNLAVTRTPEVNKQENRSAARFSPQTRPDAMDSGMDTDGNLETAQDSKPAYHTGRILVKFTPEEIQRIKQGKRILHGKLGRRISSGGFYEVFPEKGESVETLLGQYDMDEPEHVRYAQLDYECRHQYR